MKNVLAIGGTDPSGGAGLAADQRTIHALGAWPLTVTTAVVAQNTTEVLDWSSVDAGLVWQQLQAVEQDITIDAIKIGMIGTRDVAAVVLRFLKTQREHNPKLPVVVDPLFRDGKGETDLVHGAARETIEEITQLADLVTPNTSERSMFYFGKTSVLKKAGHDDGAGETIFDTLVIGDEELSLEALPKHSVDARGTGCTLASAIATFLAQGDELIDAVEKARRFVNRQIDNAVEIGAGRPLLENK